VARAASLLGLGREGFRPIPADDHFRVDVTALRDRIRADRDAGERPVCVVGNAGTVNTGSFDDLTALARLCREESLWFHIDGAFGAFAAAVPELRALCAGLEQADSIAFDLHKWLHVPYDAAAVLVRDRDIQGRTFEMGGAYLAPVNSGVSNGAENLMRLGPQQSRSFRALKVWMTFQEHGADKLAALIHQNVRQAAELAAQVDRQPDLERLAPAPLNIVCFRYRGKLQDEATLNALNRELVAGLQDGGVVLPSFTVLDGRFTLRVAIANHRTRREDLELLLELVLARGAELEAVVRGTRRAASRT
jgi:glutamate/tyrosine decarboxylase-like PLP-dependent enzyme